MAVILPAETAALYFLIPEVRVALTPPVAVWEMREYAGNREDWRSPPRKISPRPFTL